MKDYKVGLYLRLSRDDKNSNRESMSISNQRDLLTDYAAERGWQVEDIYIDDGVSGTTFDRPSFKRMIADIEKKRINLVIDEEAAKTVKRIFHMYSIGYTARHIADTFNQEGILSPREYFYNMIGKPNPYINETTLWGSASVMRILRNQVYIGHMCNGKRRNRSFKLKQRDVVDENEWIVVENTHEAIVDTVTWERVQKSLDQNKRNSRAKTVQSEGKKLPALFAGKLKCADCKAVMHYTYSKSGKYKAYYKYRCSTYTNQGKTACSFHSIREDELTAIVLNDIHELSRLFFKNSDEMLKVLLDLNSHTKLNSNAQLDKQIRKLQVEQKDVENRIDVLLDERVGGNVSDAMFKKLMSKYEARQGELTANLSELKAKLATVQDDTANIKHLIKRFKDCVYIDKLDRETVCDLIDYVLVHKKEKAGKGYTQKISIHYNFVGELFGYKLMEFIRKFTGIEKKKDQTAS